jgi:L-ascorbate metabolism protein UlaG (beta-lactamase superfamily)
VRKLRLRSILLETEGPSGLGSVHEAAEGLLSVPAQALDPQGFRRGFFAACFAVFARLVLSAGLAFSAQTQIEPSRPTHTFETQGNPVKITPIYHTSMLIEVGNKNIYVDPAKPANFAGLPPADLILITDVDGDQFDPGAVAALSTAYTQILAPPAAINILPTARPISNGEITEWGGWIIEAVPVSGTGSPARDKLNGYVLNYRSTTFYISGDTRATPRLRALEKIDVAFVSMNPRTMSPEQAAALVLAFRPKIVYPYGYRGSDPGVLARTLKGSGIDVRLLDWYPNTR